MENGISHAGNSSLSIYRLRHNDEEFNKLYADYMESSNYVNGVIVEYVEGIEVIKAFNQSSTSYEKIFKGSTVI